MNPSMLTRRKRNKGEALDPGTVKVYIKYHPTSGLMQILHFDWLRYYRSISNSHRVAKFAGFANLFVSFYSQINIFLLFFCPTSWLIQKQLDPSPFRATDQ